MKIYKIIAKRTQTPTQRKRTLVVETPAKQVQSLVDRLQTRYDVVFTREIKERRYA
jgi:hypothetical protein